MTGDGFPASVVSAVLGLNYTTLDYWARTGLLGPSVQPARGRGSRRLYSFLDMLALKVALRLRDEGVPLEKLRQVVWHLKAQGTGLEQPLASSVLLSDGGTVRLLDGDKQHLTDILRRGELVWVIAIGRMAKDLKAAAGAYAARGETGEKHSIAGADPHTPGP